MAVPEIGDLVTINFNPKAGHEQEGRRPAIILSPYKFNNVTGFASLCPITHTERGWGYEVRLPDGLKAKGVILTDQLKNLDLTARNVQIIGKAPRETVEQCIKKINTYISMQHLK